MLELIRAKTASVYGSLMAMLTILKAQPTGYNRDLQEDRGAVADALDQCVSSLRIMAAMWRRLEVVRDRRDVDETLADFEKLAQKCLRDFPIN